MAGGWRAWSATLRPTADPWGPAVPPGEGRAHPGLKVGTFEQDDNSWMPRAARTEQEYWLDNHHQDGGGRAPR